MALHDELVHRGGRIRVLGAERLAHVEQRVRGPLMGGEDAQELAKPEPGGGETAAAELLQREVVHLVRARTRRIARRPDRHAGAGSAPTGPRARGVERGHGLARLLLDPAAQLREPLLALARELLHGHELLLDLEQLGLRVAAQLDQVGLLGGELFLDHGQERTHRVELGGALAIGPRALDPERLDLELDPPHVALERASGGEPQAEERRAPRACSPGPLGRAQGCFRASPPATISVSSRRFWAHASSFCPHTKGRPLPYDTLSLRPASMPWLTRYCFAAMARRLAGARVYSLSPRAAPGPPRPV